MTVSGLGSAHTPRTPAAPALRAQRTEKAHRNDFDHLTGADRELIHEATGQRLAPGFDPAREPTTTFAAALAAERAAGRLAPGQPVTAVYLKDLNRRFDRSGMANPLGPYLGKALDYLARSGARRIDVSA
ncbi:hypothetical protein [Actinoplanes subtropicus]|uniref:hypothetical protein n=1 Tax=Actinoplanes subtropicus TaxID=543632 RepID=UPI0004C4005C|nr:hypothetical protein [Actinoplanes subtropicus]